MSVLQFCTLDNYSNISIATDNDDGIYLIGQKTNYYILHLLRCCFDENNKNAYARWFSTAHDDAFWSAFVCIIKCCTGGRDVVIIIN